MATGDDAIAAGMDVVAGTADRRQGYDEINKTRDYIAQRTSAVTPVAKGGTGASTAQAARSNLGIPAVSAPGVALENGVAVFGPNKRLQVQDPEQPSDATTKYWVDNTIAYHRGQLQTNIDGANAAAGAAQSRADEANGNGIAARQGNLYTDSYNRSLSGTRRAAWLQDNGQLGYAASSERYKKFIHPEDVTDEQILQLTLVSYQWRAAVATDDRREMGLIAERLVEAGLGWACFFGENGVEGINYEMIGIALLPAVQRLIVRVARLEES